MPKRYIYGLYDDEDNLIDKGNASELSKKYNILSSSIWHNINRGTKLNRQYTVKKLCEDNYVKYAEKEKPKRKNKHTQNLEYLVEHLRRYGNTVFASNPKDYIDELKNLGLEVSVRKVKETKSNNAKYLYKSEKYFYILEVIK